MTRRLRRDRMLRRVRETRTVELLRASGEEVRGRAATDWLPPAFTLPAEWNEEETADWQRYWDQVMAEGRPHRIITLPSRTVIRPSRPRKSTPRGLPRMREHTRSLLLGALRGDGTPRSAARIAVCRAYRVLPGEIGLTTTCTEPNGATP
jgi:hypothetical protein